MPAKPSSTVPLARPLKDALADSAALMRLSERVHESKARCDAVRAVLPENLRASVQPGPLDEAGWSLLAANAAVAAKLRQLMPRLEQGLAQAGWPHRLIRIKVRSH